MIRLRDTQHSSTADFLASAVRVAEYYGFQPLESVRAVRLPQQKRRQTGKSDSDIAYARREERPLTSVARRCASCAVGSPAGFLAWRTTSGAGGLPSVSFELHVVGTHSAIAEALLLVVANAIAEEAGIRQRTLFINNIGSHESSNRFVRDVAAYLRKHIETISPTLRPRAAEDPLGALVQLIERGHPAVPRAPQPMEYLTEDERRRFWDFLEYLEVCGLPYELSPHVLGSRDCWAHSLYELAAVDEESGSRIVFAFGGRYDPLVSRFASTHTPAAMISINCEVRGKTRLPKSVPGSPSMFFAHLGPEARRQTLVVLEMLRKADIPVHQSILHERLGEQMAHAKRLGAPYILILGYKEAMEHTILVREVATNSQEAVPLSELPGYLRRRRIALSKAAAA